MYFNNIRCAIIFKNSNMSMSFLFGDTVYPICTICVCVIQSKTSLIQFVYLFEIYNESRV